MSYHRRLCLLSIRFRIQCSCPATPDSVQSSAKWMEIRWTHFLMERHFFASLVRTAGWTDWANFRLCVGQLLNLGSF
jgi:hypothetical protein